MIRDHGRGDARFMAKEQITLPDGLGADDAESWLAALSPTRRSRSPLAVAAWRVGLRRGRRAGGRHHVGAVPVNAQRTQPQRASRRPHQEVDSPCAKARSRRGVWRRRSRRWAATATGCSRAVDDRTTRYRHRIGQGNGSAHDAGAGKPRQQQRYRRAAQRLRRSLPQSQRRQPLPCPPPPAARDAAQGEVTARSRAAQADDTAAPPSVIQADANRDAADGAETNASAADEAPRTGPLGVDLGSAHSIEGLRALWRGCGKSHMPQLEGCVRSIAVQERKNGLGVQLRLVAGPSGCGRRRTASARRSSDATAMQDRRLRGPAPLAARETPAEARPPRAQARQSRRMRNSAAGTARHNRRGVLAFHRARTRRRAARLELAALCEP